MWPLSRLAGESGGPRLTREPARSAPRFVRRSVSGSTSAEKPSARGSSAVRHTPLTAMLAPSLISSSTVAQRIARRAPVGRVSIAATVPSSSIIPVNIQVALHGEFVGRNRVHGDVVDADGVGPAAAADAAGERQGLEAAQNFWPVIEEHAIHELGLQ